MLGKGVKEAKQVQKALSAGSPCSHTLSFNYLLLQDLIMCVLSKSLHKSRTMKEQHKLRVFWSESECGRGVQVKPTEGWTKAQVNRPLQ